jgi:hypothetical protein
MQGFDYFMYSLKKGHGDETALVATPLIDRVYD